MTFNFDVRLNSIGGLGRGRASGCCGIPLPAYISETGGKSGKGPSREPRNSGY